MLRTLIGSLLTLFVLCATVRSQETVLELTNGSVFRGRITVETETYLDVEVDKGRIRILKRDIVARQDMGEAPENVTGGGTDPATPTAPDQGEGPGGRRGLKALGQELLGRIFTRPPEGAEVGMAVATPAGTLGEAPLPEGSPEHTVASFLQLVIEGRCNDAIQTWVDQEDLLESFFPFHAKGLTRYSRKLALKSWNRILRTVFADPQLLRSVPPEQVSIHTVRESANSSLVEVTGPVPGSGDGTFTHLFTVKNGRITDFGGLLASLRDICRDMAHLMRETEMDAAMLLPLLDKTVEQLLALQGRSESSFPDVAVPEVGELREVQPPRRDLPGELLAREESGYSFILPPRWKVDQQGRKPRYADILLHDSRNRAFAMVVMEKASMALTALERAVRSKLVAVSSESKMGMRRMVATPAGTAVRFHAEALIDGVRLVYDFHLISTRRGSYQVITWCLKEDEPTVGPVMQDLLDSFEVLPQEEERKQGEPAENEPAPGEPVESGESAAPLEKPAPPPTPGTGSPEPGGDGGRDDG